MSAFRKSEPNFPGGSDNDEYGVVDARLNGARVALRCCSGSARALRRGPLGSSPRSLESGGYRTRWLSRVISGSAISEAFEGIGLSGLLAVDDGEGV